MDETCGNLETVDALTIRQAATVLGVTPQRVSQRLADGTLAGPPPPTGDRRNAPRVWVDSLESLQAAETAGPTSTRPAAPQSEAEVRALRYDAERLRLALDSSRDHLTRQRRQTKNTAALLAEVASTLQKTVAALQEQIALAEDADRITEAYSSVLTNHLTNDGPLSP